MKRYLWILALLIFGYSVCVPQMALAHFSVTDNAMTVELHVDPDDDPIPGQNAALYFLFSDANNQFALAQCTCIVSISEQGKQLFKQKLIEKKDAKPSIWGASMSYTFPKRGVYQIRITGEPTTANAFQPFDLSWNFRVDATNPSDPGVDRQAQLNTELEISAVGVIFLALIGWIIKSEVFDTRDLDKRKESHYNKLQK